MLKFEIFFPFYVFNNNDRIMFPCVLIVNYSKSSSNYKHSVRKMILITQFDSTLNRNRDIDPNGPIDPK